MSITKIYKELLTEQFVKDKILTGDPLTADQVKNELSAYLDSIDLTLPQFDSENYHVDFKEESSATKFNNTFSDIYADLCVLYKEMLELGDIATITLESWRHDVESLEKDLTSLEKRIENLLLLTKQTDGYFSIFVDNFDNENWIDKTYSTAFFDTNKKLVTLGKTDQLASSRIFLEEIDPQDITFKVRSTSGFIERTDAPGTSLTDVVLQARRTWWTQIAMKTATPVTCELFVKLGDEAVELNKIIVELHDSCRSAPLQITPLYSLDNYNYSQVPSNTYTQETRSTCVFSFKAVTAKYVKFVLTKTGPDPSIDNSSITFQFGFKEISFWNESFTSGASQILVSNPISIKDPLTSLPTAFNKLSLEVCERVETDTSIDYFVTVSDNPTVPITGAWYPISPISHTNPKYPTVLELSDIEDIEIGIDLPLGISYDPTATLINPAESFILLSEGTPITEDIVVATAPRYAFANTNERILDFQVKDFDYTGSGTGAAINVDNKSFMLFRNVGVRSIDANILGSTVRGVQRGWGFVDPYYSCVVEVRNPEGISIDFGPNEVIIDDRKYTGVVSRTVLSGRTKTDLGLHRIQVHKSNWQPITPGCTSLDEITKRDLLYPYNHKLLIEGYDYPDNFPTNEEQIYKGVDLFAEMLAKQVSIFDLIGSVQSNEYKYFAVDRDAPNTHTGGNASTRVFVVKVDDSNADFQNEKFVLRFKLVNQDFKYLRFKANFATNNGTVTPALDSYKIKFG